MPVRVVASRPRSPNSPERSERDPRRGLVSRGQIQHNATAPFRPPYGAYDDATRRAAETCGFSTLIEWTATLTKGVLRVAVRRPLRGGDIILLHFVPSLYNDLQFLAVQLPASHLRVARLETYVT